ncbi:matrilin-1-like [Ciona intestinalis]
MAGKAMEYTSNAMLVQANGNRPDAPNIVLLITDAMSQDSVISEAARLRSQTEKIIAIGVDNSASGGSSADRDELISITGDSGNVLMLDELTRQSAATVAPMLCPNPC